MKQISNNTQFDIIVIGAGHAGCEAALASARMGMDTLLLATDERSVAMMPCNPAIGGTGKGHLVREIDALGGQMGLTIDETLIQSRMLNASKGPAVHSLRAQADKEQYHQAMLRTILGQDNLHLVYEEAIDILVSPPASTNTNTLAHKDSYSADFSTNLNQGENVEIQHGQGVDFEKQQGRGVDFEKQQGRGVDVPSKQKTRGVRTADGNTYYASAIIIATGTYLGGKTFMGDVVKNSGPAGLAPANQLAVSLKELGLPLRRFKTGTPARAKAESLDYSKMQEQVGDDPIVPFSFSNDSIQRDQVSCWLTYTNEQTHTVIRNNFHRSALFGGLIEGVGPRYCPSIEDKINRFADKKRHQLFVEPEGLATNEVYLQGMSTSLPVDVQQAFYSTIAGLENIVITKPGYAIEYDCIDPTYLRHSLEYKGIENLFCAGQFNGSSGYEEAAAQGLMAGINAALKLQSKESLILKRSEAYIGVLIDDLVLKGTNEPYRIMTSRAEYRVVLRQDNADVRLSKIGAQIGLLSKTAYARYLEKRKRVILEMERLRTTEILPGEMAEYLANKGFPPAKNKVTLAELLKRPGIDYASLAPLDKNRPCLTNHEKTQAEVEIKYEGYIDKQLRQIEKFSKLENRSLPEDIDYHSLKGLRLEAAQKLTQFQPKTLEMAARISGVSPADINVLLIWLTKERK